MPRKTRRRISGTRKSRRIRRRGTRRSGTRIRGGNRRYHNGGQYPFIDKFAQGYRILEDKVQKHPTIQEALDKGKAALGAVAARGKAALVAAKAAAKEKYSSITNPS